MTQRKKMINTETVEKLYAGKATSSQIIEGDYEEISSYNGLAIVRTIASELEVKDLQSQICLRGYPCNAHIDFDADSNKTVIKQKNVNTSSFLFPDTVLDQIIKNYTLVKSSQVELFLNEYRFLAEPITEIHSIIREIFGENVSDLCLALDVDPEEDFTGLSVVIKTPLTHDLSLKLLDEFDEWWLDQTDDVRALVTVMVRKE